MTTAARPTWAPAKGGNEQGGTRIFGPSQKYSSRDIASHTTLKPRCVYLRDVVTSIEKMGGSGGIYYSLMIMFVH